MTGSASLAQQLVAGANELDLTIATAESCTAGALAVALADAEGGGRAFHGGFVVYTKTNKTAALGVPAGLISAYTAVSRAVAEAMAANVLDRTPADLALAITGVLGPDPDEDGNPVGLMHIAMALRGRHVEHRCYTFDHAERDNLRARAQNAALAFAVEVLQRERREERVPLA